MSYIYHTSFSSGHMRIHMLLPFATATEKHIVPFVPMSFNLTLILPLWLVSELTDINGLIWASEVCYCTSWGRFELLTVGVDTLFVV